MTLRVLSMTGVLLETQTTSVTVPALDGSVGIRTGHAPMIAALKAGTVSYQTEAGIQTLTIPGGILEVLENVITILTDGGR